MSIAKFINLKRLFKIAAIHFLIITAAVIISVKLVQPPPTDLQIVCYFITFGIIDLGLTVGWFTLRAISRTLKTIGKVLHK